MKKMSPICANTLMMTSDEVGKMVLVKPGM